MYNANVFINADKHIYLHMYVQKQTRLLAETNAVVRYVSKRMQPICNICAPHSDKKCAALLWFASGFVQQAWNTILQRFCQTRHNFFSYMYTSFLTCYCTATGFLKQLLINVLNLRTCFSLLYAY